MKLILSSAAVALFTAGAAAAGGFVAPVVEDVFVEPVVVPQIGNWEGGYVGGTLGYAFGGDDVFGVHDTSLAPDTYLGQFGKFELSGANVGLRAGYRWQRGQWVFGPEISVEGGSIKDDFNADIGGDSVHFESKLRTLAALKLKGGYEVAPNTLITGVVGVAEGRFQYEISDPDVSDTFKYSRSGYVIGVGVEHKFNDNWSVTGEIERNQFKKKDVYLDDTVYTTASDSFTNVKLGVNFNF